MIKAIFFDLGNVILKEGYQPGIRYYEKKYAIPKGELYQAAHGHQHWKNFTLGLISEQEYLTQVDRHFSGDLDTTILNQAIYDHIELVSGVLDFICQLKGFYILGLISNYPKELFEWCEKRFGFEDLFTVRAISGLVHIRKPDLKIFRYALNQARVKPSEVIYVDDREDRVGPARSLGINVIVFTLVASLKTDIDKLIK
ncbi:MAG: HAD-IA family hydrolase [Candidatus Jacksonbacteria bacterium]